MHVPIIDLMRIINESSVKKKKEFATNRWCSISVVNQSFSQGCKVGNQI